MNKWHLEEVSKLRRLAASGTLFYTEIAKELGRKPDSVRRMARKLNLPSTRETLSHRFGKWNTKHSHLREAAMKYFLTHSMKETEKKFKLTRSEMKSLFTTGYGMPEFRHLRKDARDHSHWSAKQLKFLLQHAGLGPRKWIAKQIGRGNEICIKERMQTLGIASRNLQGLTLSQFRIMFNAEPAFFIQTDSGPGGGPKGTLPTRWKIIPFVWINNEIKAKKLKVRPEIKMFIDSRAQFQEWIFEGKALKKMKKITRESLRAQKVLK